MEQFDVTIIGAGLAGLQCARLLGKQGLRVLLADRKASLDQKIHTTGIFVRRTLETFDIPEDCLGPAVRNVSLYSPSLRALHLESKHDEYRVGKMARLYSRYLDQCLLAGVTWLPSSTYLDSTQAQDANTVRLKVGESVESIKTRFTIGADGACSRVARDLELQLNREWIVGVEDVYDNITLPGPPRLLCFLDPKLAPGYIAWIAYDGEQTHVGVGGYPNQFDPTAALEEFQTKVRGIVDLRRGEKVERRGGRIPVGGVLQNIANKYGLLIGDAAGAVSPLTAGGLDPCMRLSTLAARITTAYLSTGESEVLKDYSGQLFRSKFTSRLWARRFATHVSSRASGELICALLRLPVLTRIAASVFFGRGSFPDVHMDLSTQAQLSDSPRTAGTF